MGSTIGQSSASVCRNRPTINKSKFHVTSKECPLSVNSSPQVPNCISSSNIRIDSEKSNNANWNDRITESNPKEKIFVEMQGESDCQAETYTLDEEEGSTSELDESDEENNDDASNSPPDEGNQ